MFGDLKPIRALIPIIAATRTAIIAIIRPLLPVKNWELAVAGFSG